MPVFESLTELYEDIGRIAGYIDARGWAEASAGNFSVNVSHLDRESLLWCYELIQSQQTNKNLPLLNDQFFVISSSGSRMRDIAKHPESWSLMMKALEGERSYGMYHYPETDLKVTSEVFTHLEMQNLFLENQSENKVLLHCHATELIALSHHPEYKSAENITRLLWSMHPETRLFIPRGVGLVPFIPPGNQEIGELTRDAFRKYDVVVWEKHGVLAAGKDMGHAYDLIDVCCKSADIYFRCKSAGFEPEKLSTGQLDDLKTYYQL